MSSVSTPFVVTKYNYHLDNDDSKAKCSGQAFILNKVSYNWREMANHELLKEMLQTRRTQKYSRFIKPSGDKIKPLLFHNSSSTAAINEGSEGREKVTMAVCLPCFNEEWKEMSGTLRSLSENIKYQRSDGKLVTDIDLHVVVFMIQDGWGKASESLKKGITEEFGCPCPEWISNIPEVKENSRKEGSITIIAPDAEVYYPSGFHGSYEIGTTFHPIFITKSRNAQKFNSHLQFFALCQLLKPDCVFLTDCGTIYKSDCLYTLTEYLVRNHREVAGVTARQRVMREIEIREVQEDPAWGFQEEISTARRIWDKLLWWISPAPLQGFEFESTFLLNTAMFNLVGALPVLPGPCQLIWYDHLCTRRYVNTEAPLDMYFRQLDNVVDNSTGIVQTSLLLAEDRVLSFSLIFRNLRLRTEWVNGATFSYEPMMTWIQLLGQRRRWINGTIAAFVYYLFDKKGKEEVKISGIEGNRFLPFLWNLQLYQSAIQTLSPAFFCISIFEGMLELRKSHPDFLITVDSSTFAYVYFVVYVLWVFNAMVLGKKPLSWSSTFYNIFMEVIYRFFNLINLFACGFVFSMILRSSAGSTAGNALAVMIFLWVVPFVLDLFLSRKSAWLYLLYIIPFLLQLAQYVTFIPAFALARLHDFSWGNRDSEAHKGKEEKEKEFLFFTLKVNTLTIIFNFLILFSYILIEKADGHTMFVIVPLSLILFMPMFFQVLLASIFILKTFFSCLIGNGYSEHKVVQINDTPAHNEGLLDEDKGFQKKLQSDYGHQERFGQLESNADYNHACEVIMHGLRMEDSLHFSNAFACYREGLMALHQVWKCIHSNDQASKIQVGKMIDFYSARKDNLQKKYAIDALPQP